MNKKGLVLEGGGMRGIFTAGVLDFFLEKNIEFDDVIGVSAGACHACSFLSRQHGRAFDISVDYLDDKHYCGTYSLLTTGDIFGVKMIYETIPNKLNPIDREAFLKNKTEFYAVVTNCITGECEYHKVNNMSEDVIYVRASSSMPLVSRMVMINAVPYLDGGISDSIPIRESFRMGNIKNIVVMTQPRGYRKQADSIMPLVRLKYRKYPKLIEQIENRNIKYNETLDFIYEQEKCGNLFIIQPQHPIGLRRIEKNAEKLKMAYDLGYHEAKSRFDDMMDYLKK